jgi:hypothetical protein
MCHSLSNIEHHQFKFEFHRRPGDLHIHFFGADAFSFGDGVRLEDSDVMQVRFEGFGRALRNPLSRAPLPARVVAVPSDPVPALLSIGSFARRDELWGRLPACGGLSGRLGRATGQAEAAPRGCASVEACPPP